MRSSLLTINEFGRTGHRGCAVFFMRTAAVDRILTADDLLHRGWKNNYFCPVRMRNLETPFYLLSTTLGGRAKLPLLLCFLIPGKGLIP